MRKQSILMHEIFGTKEFQVFQDDIAASVGLAIIVVDYLGKPITRHSCITNFCDLVRHNPNYKMLCERCDSRGGLEAVRTRSPYIYLCHANLVDFAIPIVLDNTYVGAFMAGEVVLSNPEDNEKLEKIYSSTNIRAAPNFLDAYRTVPVMSLEKIQAIARTLHAICNMLVENKLAKKNLLDEGGIQTPETGEVFPEETEPSAQISELLDIALQYIDDHLYEDLSLKKVAAACNMSPNYFGRVFSKHLHMKFTEYITEKRIEHAKKLLLVTDMSVNEISERLGFTDCSYFIKKFKALVGKTPVNYRKEAPGEAGSGTQ